MLACWPPQEATEELEIVVAACVYHFESAQVAPAIS